MDYDPRSRTLVFDNTLKRGDDGVVPTSGSRTLVFDNTLKLGHSIPSSMSRSRTLVFDNTLKRWSDSTLYGA